MRYALVTYRCAGLNVSMAHRRGLTSADWELIEMLDHFAISYLPVLTKADKVWTCSDVVMVSPCVRLLVTLCCMQLSDAQLAAAVERTVLEFDRAHVRDCL